MHINLYRIIFLFAFSFIVYAQQSEIPDIELLKKAEQLAKDFIIVDTHIDAPLQLRRAWRDISQKNSKGEFDYVRAKEGGLDVGFMSIYTSASMEFNGAFERADSLIDIVNRMESEWPDNFLVVTSVKDVLDNSSSGKITCDGNGEWLTY